MLHGEWPGHTPWPAGAIELQVCNCTDTKLQADINRGQSCKAEKQEPEQHAGRLHQQSARGCPSILPGAAPACALCQKACGARLGVQGCMVDGWAVIYKLLSQISASSQPMQT